MEQQKRRFKIVIEVEPWAGWTQRDVMTEIRDFYIRKEMSDIPHGCVVVRVSPYHQSPLLFKAARLLRALTEWSHGNVPGELTIAAGKLADKVLGGDDE